MRGRELIASTMVLSRLSIQFYRKFLTKKKRWWPKRTPGPECKNKVERHDSNVCQQYLMCLSLDYIIYVSKWAISVFPPHRLIMDVVTWLTWAQMTYIRIRNIQNVSTWGIATLGRFHIFEENCLMLLSALRIYGILWPCKCVLMTS